MQLLVQNLHFKFEDYINFITEEGPIVQQDQDLFENGRKLEIHEVKVWKLRNHIQNLIYFLKTLRKKQAMIRVKNQIEGAIKQRQDESDEMRKQIEECVKILSEGLSSDQ